MERGSRCTVDDVDAGVVDNEVAAGVVDTKVVAGEVDYCTVTEDAAGNVEYCRSGPWSR